MYPLDDTFIHLEIANHLAHGNWGINEYEFSSASSSLLYTIILTGLKFLSIGTIGPFIVNCLAGALIIIVLHLWLKKQGVNPVSQIGITWLVIFFTPLTTMVISGMEHTIQCLASFLFIFYFSDWLEKSRNDNKKNLPWHILLFAVIVASIRYEGLFLIAIAGLLLLYYKNFKAGFILGFFSLLPVVAFGFFSLTKGSYFLPNSVLVKSETNTSGVLGYLTNIFVDKLISPKAGIAAMATQRWALILPLLYILFRKYLTPSYSFILIFLMGGTILQLALAATGWLYRYEAYLFLCSVVITCTLFYKYGKAVFAEHFVRLRMLAALIIFFLFFPIVLRSMAALVKVDRACKNIFEQQYQMGQFAKKYYDSSTIAANDIGAVSYYTKGTIVDLWGLASIEVTKSKRNNKWTPQFLDSLCRAKNVKVAMIYDVWFSDSLTSRWKKVATWQIQNNVICGDDIVSFYSLDSSNSAALYKNLKNFQPQLPASIGIRYY